VGKSTLVNRILGEERQEVREIRSHDDRGRHTTTSRRLFFVPRGGMLIDTPGIRELQLWSADDGFGETFRDVEEAAKLCRFTDCVHQAGTLGCNVQMSIENELFCVIAWRTGSKWAGSSRLSLASNARKSTARRKSAGERSRWRTESVTIRR
jgi:ribosome biogenesis GTPase